MKLLCAVCALPLLMLLAVGEPQADAYVDAVRELNEKHARAPGKLREEELAQKLPPAASAALEQLLSAKSSPGLAAELVRCAEAALDLDRLEDFGRIRARLEQEAPDEARGVGVALSRPRLLLRGLGGLDERYLERFAEVFEGVLAAYDEVFGFAEFSKVPGKKLRVRVRLVDVIEAPPHFAPQFPFHSEIDFPVIDAAKLASPTADGKFLFYGLCHELGHVVAMWGDRQEEEDHHAWAHYTGVVIVEHLAERKDAPAWMKGLRDAQWRSLAKEREATKGVVPGLGTKAEVMALLVGLHDRVGPKAIGAAINALDLKDDRLRVNRVRYYRFAELKKALLAGAKQKDKRKAIEELLP